MNTELRKKAKNNFEKEFFKLMNNAVFGKTMKNVRNHRDITLVKTDKRRNQLASEPNYNAINWFSEKLLAIEMKKTKVEINKSVYLGMPILDISKTLLYESWYDYTKPKYDDNVKLCYICEIVLSFILKQKIFMKILQMMLKKNLIPQIMRLTELCLQEKIKR